MELAGIQSAGSGKRGPQSSLGGPTNLAHSHLPQDCNAPLSSPRLNHGLFQWLLYSNWRHPLVVSLYSLVNC